MTETTQLGLPLLMPSQAQKHVTVNEALARLDGLVQAVVVDATRTSPPADPDEGQAHIVAGPGPTDAWEGWEGDIAVWFNGAWLRLEARVGWRVWSLADETLLVRTASGWQGLAEVLGVIGAAALGEGVVERLGINAAADATNGFVFRGTNALLQSDASIDATLNKAAPGQDASLSFKTGYSARALLGLLASDDFSLKVSADGASYAEALHVASAGGVVTLGQGARVPAGSAAAPGLAVAGDTDTGLFQPGANILGIATGGAERARVTGAGLQVTGLISGTAVTQSHVDTTTGRLMKAGDFGIGQIATVPEIPDLNATTTPVGNYYYANTTPNFASRPSGAAAQGTVIVTRAFAGTLQQELIEGSSAATGGRRWIRDYTSGRGTWSAWRLQWNEVTLPVTTSALDSSAGRVMKVGDAGILGAPPNAPADIGVTDNSLAPGVWMFAGSGTGGLPANLASSSNSYVFHHRRTHTAEVQMILAEFASADADRTIWFRRRTGGAWGNWKRVYDWSNILGTVSQSGGSPTGAVIERGSNANGEFVRFADGTQICTYYSPAVAADSAIGAMFRTAVDQSWNYPAAFAAGTEPACYGRVDGGGTARSVQFGAGGHTGVVYRQYCPVSDAATCNAALTAIGRWF